MIARLDDGCECFVILPPQMCGSEGCGTPGLDVGVIRVVCHDNKGHTVTIVQPAISSFFILPWDNC